MKLGLIGGSGLYEFAALESPRCKRTMTRWGEPSAPLTVGRLHGQDIVFLPRHGADHRIPPHLVNYRANIAALHAEGVTDVVGCTAVGGISATTGEIVVPRQIIDYTYGREHTYADGSAGSVQHIDFTEPYDGNLRQQLLSAATACGIPARPEGVYGATQGPRLETAAEINRLEHDGCTIVGMTGMPEAALARELTLGYANLSLVVNLAAGRSAGEISMHDIEQELNQGVEKMRQIISMMLRLMQPE